MAIIGEGISHRGLIQENFHIPFFVTGTVTNADINKPVTIDSAANHSVKIAGDGDKIVGILATLENRAIEGVVVGTVAMKGGFRLTAVTGHGVTVGDTVIGSATAGQVKAAAAADWTQNIVTKVDGDVIEALIL